MKLLTAIPVLLTLDISKTVAFYTTKLDFTCPYQDDGFAILQSDEVYLHFTECGDQKLIDWSSCRIAMKGIDVLYARCSAENIVHPNAPLKGTDYGTREFGILDNYGVLITFFENSM